MLCDKICGHKCEKKHKITGNSDSAVTADNVHFTNIKLIISPCLIWEGGVITVLSMPYVCPFHSLCELGLYCFA